MPANLQVSNFAIDNEGRMTLTVQNTGDTQPADMYTYFGIYKLLNLANLGIID